MSCLGLLRAALTDNQWVSSERIIVLMNAARTARPQRGERALSLDALLDDMTRVGHGREDTHVVLDNASRRIFYNEHGPKRYYMWCVLEPLEGGRSARRSRGEDGATAPTYVWPRLDGTARPSRAADDVHESEPSADQPDPSSDPPDPPDHPDRAAANAAARAAAVAPGSPSDRQPILQFQQTSAGGTRRMKRVKVRLDERRRISFEPTTTAAAAAPAAAAALADDAPVAVPVAAAVPAPAAAPAAALPAPAAPRASAPAPALNLYVLEPLKFDRDTSAEERLSRAVRAFTEQRALALSASRELRHASDQRDRLQREAEDERAKLRRQADAQSQRAARAESIGAFAGSMHDARVENLKATVAELHDTIRQRDVELKRLRADLEKCERPDEARAHATIPTSRAMMYTKSGAMSKEYRRRRKRERVMLDELVALHGGVAALHGRFVSWIKEAGPTLVGELLQEAWVSKTIITMINADARAQQASMAHKTTALVARARLHGMGRRQWDTIHSMVETGRGSAGVTIKSRLGPVRTCRVIVSEIGMHDARYHMYQQNWFPSAPLDGAALAVKLGVPAFENIKCAMRDFKNYLRCIVRMIMEVPCLRANVKVCSVRVSGCSVRV